MIESRMTNSRMTQSRTNRSRAEFRAFVRNHHPDVGGDPDTFIAGIARYRPSTEYSEKSTVDCDRSSANSSNETGFAKAEFAETKFEAPISFVVNPSGLKAVTQKVKRWRRKRTQPPRVQ